MRDTDPPSAVVLPPGTTLSEYKKLRTEWYARLKSEGFEDLEVPGPDGGFRDELFPVTGISRERWERCVEPTRAYFSMARRFLHDHDWTSWTRSRGLRRGDKRIWSSHSDGATITEIARALGTGRHYVFRRIRDLALRMRAMYASEILATDATDAQQRRAASKMCASVVRVSDEESRVSLSARGYPRVPAPAADATSSGSDPRSER